MAGETLSDRLYWNYGDLGGVIRRYREAMGYIPITSGQGGCQRASEGPSGAWETEAEPKLREEE